SCNVLLGSPHSFELIPAIGIIAFAVWGLGPLMYYLRSLFRNDSNWKKSKTYFISISYVQPLLLWTGTILICSMIQRSQKFFMETGGADDTRKVCLRYYFLRTLLIIDMYVHAAKVLHPV
ncbi:hypothetical protein B296_00057479, partial [Ensete ventricosum]